MNQLLNIAQNLSNSLRLLLVVVVGAMGMAMTVSTWARTKGQPGPVVAALVMTLVVGVAVWKLPDILYMLKNDANSFVGGGSGY